MTKFIVVLTWKGAKRPAYDAGVYPAVHSKKWADRYDSRERAEQVMARWVRSGQLDAASVEEVAK